MSIMRGGWSLAGELVIDPVVAIVTWIVAAALFLGIILLGLVLSLRTT